MKFVDVDDLPPPTAAVSRHTENTDLAKRLRANPGKWIEYPFPLTHPAGFRYRVVNGIDRAFREGFDAKVRDGRVFIAYNPE